VAERLSKQRVVFVEEYLECWNQTKAARRAGYAHPDVMGCRLVKVQVVKDLIQQRLTEKGMAADEVLFRLSQMARLSLGDFIEAPESGGWKIDLEAVKEKGHLVKRIKTTLTGPEIQLHDSQKALELMGKHHRLFVDRVEIEVDKWLILDMPTPEGAMEGPEKKSASGNSRILKRSQTK